MFSACQYLLTADIFPQHGVESKWQNRNTPRTNQDFSLRGTRSATTVGAGWFQIQNRLLNHDEETFDRRRRKGIDGSCGKTVARADRGGSVGLHRPAERAGAKSLGGGGS